MGASNALNAYRLYASRVPPLSMSALAYMALVSMDKDAEPWFSLGAEVLAVMALGRAPLAETGDEKADARARKALEHACERALKPLFEAGAITTSRHSSGHPDKPHWAKYRLWLTAPAPDEARSPRYRSEPAAPHGIRGVQNSGGEKGGDPCDGVAPHGKRGVPDDGAPRNPYSRPTESVAAPHGIHGAKEYEEQQEERSKTLEEYPLLSSDSVPSPARETRNASDGAIPVRARPLWPSAVPPPDDLRCQYDGCRRPNVPVPDGDAHHDETCRRLAAIKARAAPTTPTEMREHPAASLSAHGRHSMPTSPRAPPE
jgi:hypothetical protein